MTNGTVIVIHPDERFHGEIARSVLATWEDWHTVVLAVSDAVQFVESALDLRSALHGASTTDGLAEYDRFVDLALRLLEPPESGSRSIVLSPEIVPLDVVRDASGYWGDRAIFAHLPMDLPLREDLLLRVLTPTIRPLQSYLLVCPMAIDRWNVPRHLQDIVRTALAFESLLPVELWCQPTFDRALQSLTRADVSWLHIDTHGAASGRQLMLGPTRDGEQFVNLDQLPPIVPSPFLMLVGCSVVSDAHSAAPSFLRRGVDTVLGPCVDFVSIGITGSQEEEALWYDLFYRALYEGNDVGESLLIARRNTPGTILKYMWLLVGCPFLRFSTVSMDVA